MKMIIQNLLEVQTRTALLQELQAQDDEIDKTTRNSHVATYRQ
jgi:DNA-binding response OmpR family regulator